MEERIRVSTESLWEQFVGYSRAMRVGRHVFVAGTTAMRNGTVVGPGDAYVQTVRALEIIEEALQQAGARMADVVRTRLFVTDISRWEQIGRAHGEVFGAVRPATTMVEVRALIHPDLLVEVEAEAVISD